MVQMNTNDTLREQELWKVTDPFVELFATAYQNGFKAGLEGTGKDEPIPAGGFGENWRETMYSLITQQREGKMSKYHELGDPAAPDRLKEWWFTYSTQHGVFHLIKCLIFPHKMYRRFWSLVGRLHEPSTNSNSKE